MHLITLSAIPQIYHMKFIDYKQQRETRKKSTNEIPLINDIFEYYYYFIFSFVKFYIGPTYMEDVMISSILGCII
jgi:hypothetical protein